MKKTVYQKPEIKSIKVGNICTNNASKYADCIDAD